MLEMFEKVTWVSDTSSIYSLNFYCLSHVYGWTGERGVNRIYPFNLTGGLHNTQKEVINLVSSDKAWVKS